MKTLYARFPEKWPGGSSSEIEWVISDGASAIESGVADSVSNLPRSDSVKIVLPYQSVSMTEIELPDAREEILQKAAVNAVADFPIDGDVHAALGGRTEGGKRAISFVDKTWLKKIVEAFRLCGIQPAAVIVDSMACPVGSIIWNGRDGFMRVSESLGFTLDLGSETAPPASLTAFIESAPISCVDLYVEDGAKTPDMTAWGEKLNSQVRVAGTWDWRNPVSCGAKEPINLLKGELAPPSGLESAMPSLKTSALLIVAIIVLWIAGAFAEWRLLKRNEKTLRRQINDVFISAFPKAGPPLEPVAQMEKAITGMKERSLAWREDGFARMMSVAIPAIGEGYITFLEYDGRKLEITAVFNREEALRKAGAKLADDGIAVKLGEKSRTRDGVKAGLTLAVLDKRRPIDGKSRENATPFGS